MEVLRVKDWRTFLTPIANAEAVAENMRYLDEGNAFYTLTTLLLPNYSDGDGARVRAAKRKAMLIFCL